MILLTIFIIFICIFIILADIFSNNKKYISFSLPQKLYKSLNTKQIKFVGLTAFWKRLVSIISFTLVYKTLFRYELICLGMVFLDPLYLFFLLWSGVFSVLLSMILCNLSGIEDKNKRVVFITTLAISITFSGIWEYLDLPYLVGVLASSVGITALSSIGLACLPDPLELSSSNVQNVNSPASSDSNSESVDSPVPSSSNVQNVNLPASSSSNAQVVDLELYYIQPKSITEQTESLYQKDKMVEAWFTYSEPERIFALNTGNHDFILINRKFYDQSVICNSMQKSNMKLRVAVDYLDIGVKYAIKNSQLEIRDQDFKTQNIPFEKKDLANLIKEFMFEIKNGTVACNLPENLPEDQRIMVDTSSHIHKRLASFNQSLRKNRTIFCKEYHEALSHLVILFQKRVEYSDWELSVQKEKVQHNMEIYEQAALAFRPLYYNELHAREHHERVQSYSNEIRQQHMETYRYMARRFRN